MNSRRESLGVYLLAAVFLAASSAGLIVLWAAWPRNSNTSPLVALAAALWSSVNLAAAVLTWRGSRFAGLALIAAMALLLFPARFIVPGGELLLPASVLLTLVAFLGYRYLAGVSRASAPCR